MEPYLSKYTFNNFTRLAVHPTNLLINRGGWEIKNKMIG